MSKSGRYSADRKKIEALSASKTVEVHDCGTVFICTGAITLTLPAASTAGAGWWCRVVKASAAGAGTVSITATSTLQGVAVDGNSVDPLVGDCAVLQACAEGAFIEVISDGSQYYAYGIGDHNTGFTL
jgi:hypothetical protein